MSRGIFLLLAVLATVLAAACGSVATPEWAAGTQAALLATDEHLTAIAPTATPLPPTATPIPPTETPVPPTATALPPTETPIPPTLVPATVAVEVTESAATLPDGDAANGQTIFTTMYTTANGNWSCSMCHSVTPDEMRLIGPGLWNVSVHAETRVEGQSAYDYIHTSIIHPNDFLAPGDPAYPANLMPPNWAEVLTEDQINDIITYLYTLRDDSAAGAAATQEASSAVVIDVPGDPTAGQTVFTSMFTTANGTWSCSMCHTVSPDEMRLIGPGLWNISQRAGSRIEGQTAEEYVHNSILHPNDFIVPGDPVYPANLMPTNWGEVLTEEQLTNVIAYLFSLHN